jgi:hypothetical protein
MKLRPRSIEMTTYRSKPMKIVTRVPREISMMLRRGSKTKNTSLLIRKRAPLRSQKS